MLKFVAYFLVRYMKSSIYVSTPFLDKLTMDNKKRLSYSNESLNEALKAVQSKIMSIRKASAAFKIPKTTLIDKLKNKYTKSGTIGAPTVLTAEEESLLEKWILEMGDKGFPVTKAQLLESVAKLIDNLQRENPFKEGIPGHKWFTGFLKRHPLISNRVPQSLTPSRASVTEQNIRDWFSRVRNYLNERDLLDIMLDPRRIFNSDESGFYLSPKEQYVMVRKGSAKVYSRTYNDEKECLTVLVTVSADGNMQPPMVLFPYKKRIPANIHSNYPKHWAIGRSESGWMTSAAFYEYMTNVFYPWIEENKTPLPVIFFIDGHSSHINLHLSEFCKEKGIILTAFYPNATHRLQPLDVGVFHPVKNLWRKNVRNWRMENTGKRLRREDFAKILEVTLKKSIAPGIVSNAFRACGLFPFNENNVDYTKLVGNNNTAFEHPVDIKRKEQNNEKGNKEETNEGMSDSKLLLEIEKRLDPSLVMKFKDAQDEWTDEVEYKALFEFWRKLNQHDHNTTLENNNCEMLGNDETYENINIDESFWVNNSLEGIVGDDGTVTLLDVFANQSSEQTPAKNDELNEKVAYPTPFKKALYWPEQTDSKKKQKGSDNLVPPKKKIVPTVAINDEFMEHQRRLHDEKKKKEENRMNKLRKRKVSCKGDYADGKSKVAKIGDQSTAVLNGKKDQRLSKDLANYEKGEFVIVRYEEEYFPGTILEKNTDSVKIKTMTMSANNWKWPDRDDICDYLIEDVVCKIEVPTLLNSRGIYSVPEVSTIKQTKLDDNIVNIK